MPDPNPSLAVLRICIIFIRIRIQNVKKFVTDPDPGKRIKYKENLKNVIKNVHIPCFMCVPVFYLTITVLYIPVIIWIRLKILNIVKLFSVFNGICWIRIRIIWFGSAVLWSRPILTGFGSGYWLRIQCCGAGPTLTRLRLRLPASVLATGSGFGYRLRLPALAPDNNMCTYFFFQFVYKL